ncbi:MAG: cyclic nucleotide-binding domain-containing protein [Myxococcaceae bacterium]
MNAASDLLKRGEKAEAAGNFVEAAPLYERAGDVDKAINAYRRAGNADRAAMLLMQTGRGAEAAALFVSLGQPLQAAALYEKLHMYAKAAAALLRANQRERAAAMYEKADAFEDAAKIYVSLGNHRRAMQLYEQLGRQDKVQELQAELKPDSAQSAAKGVLDLDPNLDVAAGQYLETGQLVDAIVAALRKKNIQGACRYYESCQEDIGYNILSAVAGDKASQLAAAEMFMAARDFLKAGQVFENLEEYERAAQMYERGEDAYMAAEMYSRANNKAKAAENLEKQGNYKQAAEFYLDTKNFEKAAMNFERAVNNFVAGKLYLRMNNTAKSLQLLQKVAKSEREYFEACRLIGEILAANGYLDLAIRKYIEVVQTAELSDSTAVVYYNLGRALEARGVPQKAAQIYQRLAAWRLDYQDVAQRLKALANPAAAAAANPAPRMTPSAGIPAVPAAALQQTASASGADEEVLEAAEVVEEKPRAQLVSMMDGFEFLKKTALFSELSLEEMKAVYHACEVKKFNPGEVMIEQGVPGQALFIVRRGTARVVRVAEDNTTSVVAKLSPGSPAGEMALIDDAPTSARVEGDTAVEAFCITREQFERLLASNERTALKLYRFFIKTLSKRLRTTSESLAASATARA